MKKFFAVVAGLMSFSSLADDLCVEKQFSSVNLQNTKVTYLGHVDYQPMIQIEDKVHQLENDNYYLISGKIYYLRKEYTKLCFSDPTDNRFVNKLKEVPELVPIYSKTALQTEDNIIVMYHANIEGKLYYNLRDISVKGVRYKLVDGNYVRFHEWLSAQDIRKLYW